MAQLTLTANRLFAHAFRGLLIVVLGSLLIKTSSVAKVNVVQDSWIRIATPIGDFGNIEATADGGYIALSVYSGAILVKFNAAGRITWAKSTKDVPAHGVTVLPSPLGGYVGLVSVTDENFVEHPYVMRFSSTGDMLWQRGFDMRQVVSGGQRLAVATDGSIYTILIADTPIVVKLDDSGHTMWQISLSNANPIDNGTIAAMSNGDILIALHPTFESGDARIRLMRLNSAGQLIWQKFVDGYSAYSLAELGNGEIVLLSTKGLVFKLNGSGNVIWQKTYREATTFSSIHIQVKPDLANSFVVVGYTTITSPTNTTHYDNADLRIFKADNNGNLMWSKRMGLSGLGNDQSGAAIARGLDGHYLAVGKTTLSGDKGLMLRLDPSGNMTPDCVWNIPSTTQIGDATAVMTPANFIASPITLGLLTHTVTMTNQPITPEPICGQPDDNAPPIANASADHIVFFGNTLQLNGSASSDPDGDGLIYSWQQTGGDSASLISSDSPIAMLTAPTTTQTLTFTLVVTDYLGLASPPDTVTIQVREPFPNQVYLPTSLR